MSMSVFLHFWIAMYIHIPMHLCIEAKNKSGAAQRECVPAKAGVNL